jgi:hypothetical protein
MRKTRGIILSYDESETGWEGATRHSGTASNLPPEDF